MALCRCRQLSTRRVCWRAPFSDAAYGFAALDPAGIDPVGFIARAGTRNLARVRIGVGDPFLWRDCDPEIVEAVDEAVNALAHAGAIAREFILPEAEAAYAVFLQGSLSAVELRSFHDQELPEWLPQLDPVIAPAVHNAESVSARDYLARIARLRALARSAAPHLDAIDVIASPTLCLTPPLTSDVADADSHLRVNRRIVRNTLAVNYPRTLRDYDAGRSRPRRDAGWAPVDRPRPCRRAAACHRTRGGARARHCRRPGRDTAAARVVMITVRAACTRDADCRPL